MERNSSPNMKEGLPGLEQRSPAAYAEDHGKETCSPWRSTVSTDGPVPPGKPHTGQVDMLKGLGPLGNPTVGPLGFPLWSRQICLKESGTPGSPH